MGRRRLLLDVSSLGYRAFFALKDVRSPDGRPMGTVHGYLDYVARLLMSRRPDEVVHVYDHDWRPVARTDIYPGYKSTRLPDPDGLPEQFELLHHALDLTGTPQAQTRDWEAEDAIGAICSQSRSDDRIEIVSGDRDLIQLVHDPDVRLLFTLRGVSELLDDVEASSPRPGPLRGKPALRARVREARDYIAAMERLVPVNARAPVEVWSGERNDDALRALAEEQGFKGPAQRLIAAMDSVSGRRSRASRSVSAGR